MNIYVADFETTKTDSGVRVWLWCFYGNNVCVTGEEIGEFYLYLMNFMFEKGNKIYFHNLAFDGVFFVDYLLKNGYVHVEKIKHKKEFSTFIDDLGKWFNIKLTNNYKTRINIHDSLKKLPFSVSEIAKAFNLPDKGCISYDEEKPENYIPTEKEKEYVINDCRIVFNALKIMSGLGQEKQTIGSDCLEFFRHLIGGKHGFQLLFPSLDKAFEDWDTSKEGYGTIDNFARKAYFGAFCYVNPIYKNKIVGAGCVYDVNSLYPYVMHDRVYPFGIPRYGEGIPDFKDNYLYIVHVQIKFDLKNDGVPCIIDRKKRLYNIDSWVGSSNGEYLDYWFTNVDLELISANYVFSVKFVDYLEFKTMHNNPFVPYIDYWNKTKEKASKEGNKGLRTLAKLYNNNLYGKFGQNVKNTKKIPTYGNNTVALETVASEENSTIYVPIAAFCTAYAREVTITAVKKNLKNFLYADTDSMHLLGDDVFGIEVDDAKLGAWKKESTFVKGKYIRQKTYIEEDADGNYNLTCAGLKKLIYDPDSKSVYNRSFYFQHILGFKFDNFTPGQVIPHGKSFKKIVPGGVIIEDGDFTIKF